MLKNILALIGLVVLVRHGVHGFKKYVQRPLERKLTDILDEEAATAKAA